MDLLSEIAVFLKSWLFSNEGADAAQQTLARIIFQGYLRLRLHKGDILFRSQNSTSAHPEMPIFRNLSGQVRISILEILRRIPLVKITNPLRFGCSRPFYGAPTKEFYFHPSLMSTLYAFPRGNVKIGWRIVTSLGF